MSNSEWEEWLAKQPAQRVLPERLKDMRLAYGKRDDATCKMCVHLQRVVYHRHHYLKCDLSPWTHGSGTDWRAWWPGCGKYEEVKNVQ